MNFKELGNIANKHAALAAGKKKSRFGAAYKKGMDLLSQAQKEKFKNTNTLKSSSGCLIDAITLKRSDIRPYLALSYLFCILEDFKAADEYAHAALKLEPNNADVATFIDTIKAFKKDVPPPSSQVNQPLAIRVPERSPAPKESASVTPDYDALFAQLEAFIIEKTKDLFSTDHSKIGPTVNHKKYKVMLTSYENLKHVIQYMEQQVKILAVKFNVSSLEEKMTPFMVLNKRYVNALKTSENLMDVNETIELWSFKTDKQVKVVNQDLTMSALTYGRVDVERMMDGCDLIADQLDTLSENKNIDITLVEGSYSKLLSLVESLNDMVEDYDGDLENQNHLADILS